MCVSNQIALRRIGTVAVRRPMRIFILPVLVFKSTENPCYLKYWIKEELGFTAEVINLEQAKASHNRIFRRAFPTATMGRHAVLIIIASNEGFNFLLNHQPIQTSIALVYIDLNDVAN